MLAPLQRMASHPRPPRLRAAQNASGVLRPVHQTLRRVPSCACGGTCPRCHGAAHIQRKLEIGKDDGPLERDADRLADQVMRMPETQARASATVPVIQRECAACSEEDKEALHAMPGASASILTGEVPGIVHDVLRSPGQPLDAGTRAFMEPRFGYDFGDVRIHTDSKASQSARAVNARAYTVGRDIVFEKGQYAPMGPEGGLLLAHELAHVTQQYGSSSSSAGNEAVSARDITGAAAASVSAGKGNAAGDLDRTPAGPTLFRKVGSVTCAANAFGAPDDPRTALEAVDPLAVDLANQAADALATDATDVLSGIPGSPSVTFQSYQDHFGLPSAAGKGFLNRLTGVVKPSQEIAASEELAILSRRFRLVANLYSQTVNYRCPGDQTFNLIGCSAGTCGDSFAFSCRGNSTVILCQPFWDSLGSDQAKAAALIHEATHIIFGPSGLSLPGEIGEATQKGPGRNFNVAGCYEFIIDDIAGVDSSPVCPEVP
jgi:hypothetical protein